ncbi:hypothetical protein QTJ16_003724 [Diplocarpon rosae]|uniref:Nucleoporin NSP1 n=1 Tax=Diplocarpon rosae TaxID=946125 RepID=A0AAD9T0M9_9HELO|nr:hypothetical protein QTJ16_003724 [Diplocarpon rosae]
MTNNSKPFSFGGGTPTSFGSTPNTASPFGAAQPATSKPKTTSLFGSTAGGSGSGAGGIFGSSTAGGQPSIFAPSSNTGSGTSTPSFGGGNTGAPPTFGKPAATSGATGSGLFGTAGASSTSSFGAGFSFGQNNGTATQATNNDDKAPSTGLSFGNNAAKPATSTSSSNPTLTGATTPSKPTFTFQNSTTPAGPPPTDSNQAAKPPLFGSLGGKQSFGDGLGASKPGNSSSAPAPAPASTLFSANGASTGASNMFNKQPAPASSSTGLAPTPATAPQAAKPLFSFSSSNPVASTPKAQASLTAPAAANSSLFNKGPATSAAPSLFGGSATSSAASSSNLFGGTAPTTTAPVSTSLFAGLNGTAPAAASSATSVPSTTAPTSGAKLGLFGTSASTSAPPTTAPPASVHSGGLGGDSGSGGSLGGLGGGAAAGSGSGAVTGGAAQTLGASTSGPAPQMNRLKNKTMDDIITRWATDLSKYQKEFQEQAEKVATWDRLMVENGDKIQKLYLTTYEAEKQSTEIERQLANVESQQEELASWLDRYEGEVDEMFQRQVGQGEALQGPDQERERTYKLAEKLTDRLDDMGKNLTSMIEAINDASTTLSKTSKADDPLSNIVRVLNSHLTQLQWIDENATALQSKIIETHKAGLNVGLNGGGYTGPESEAADSFYRSFAVRK